MRITVTALASIVVLSACSTQPRIVEEGTIEGRVLNQDGTPLVDALVAFDPPGYGRHPTNAQGRFKLPGVQTGTRTVEFHCPSLTGLGSHITDMKVNVQVDSVSTVDIVVPSSFCYEPSYSEVRGEYSGFITYGFEHARFAPCHEKSLNLSKNIPFGLRISFELPNDQRERVKPDVRYFARVTGILKGPGNFGHMGVSQYELDIESIHQLKIVSDLASAKDCSKQGEGDI